MPRQQKRRDGLFWDLFQNVWCEIEEAYCNEECIGTTARLSDMLGEHAQFLGTLPRVDAALHTLGVQCQELDGHTLTVSWVQDSPTCKVRNRIAGMLGELLDVRAAGRRQHVPNVTCPTCHTCQQAGRMLRAFAGAVGWTVVGSNTCVKYFFSGTKPRVVGTKSLLFPTTQWSSGVVPSQSMSESFWTFFLSVWQDLKGAYASESTHATIPLHPSIRDDPDFLLNFAHVCTALSALDTPCQRTPATNKSARDTLTVSWAANGEALSGLLFKTRQSVAHTLSLLLASRHEGTYTIESACPDCPVCQRAAQTLKKFSDAVHWHVSGGRGEHGESITRIAF